jgi:photosystem II stability/assembly factor-like uncharacterized protein
MTTGDWVDTDEDGIDDRWQTGPGEPDSRFVTSKQATTTTANPTTTQATSAIPTTTVIAQAGTGPSPEVDLHSSYSCVEKELGGETWFALWNRSSTPEESQRIQHCPPATHNFPCVDNALGMDKADALFQGMYEPSEEEIERIEGCKISGSDQDDPAETNDVSGDQGASVDHAGPEDDADSSETIETTTETPEPPPTLLYGTLVDVRTPTASHQTAGSSGCSTREQGECAELRWERVTGLRTGVVGALAISPSEPDVIYAGFDSNDMGLWRSEDGGRTWVHAYESGHISGIAVSPSDSRTVIHSILEGDVFFDSEGGSGSVVARSGRGTEHVRYSAVAYSPSDSTVAYTSVSGTREGSKGRIGDSAEFYASTDGGRNWSLAGICDGCGFLYTIVVHPEHPDTIYAGTATGVRFSDDGGETWGANLLTNLSEDGAEVLGLALQPGSSKHLLAATTENGIFRSEDAGQTWFESSTGLNTPMTHRVVFASSEPEVAYVTTHQGVFRSDDSGRTWTSRSDGLNYLFVHAFAVDPRNADVAYVGTASELHSVHSRHEQEGLHAGEGIYKTVDGGRTWHLSDDDIEESNLRVMTPHPRLPFEMWAGAGAGRGGFVTTSAGESWLFSASDAAHYPMVFAYSHSFPSTQYLTSLYPYSEFIRSVDSGETWQKLGERLEDGITQQTRESDLYDPTKRWHVHSHGLAVAPSDSNIIYVGTIWNTNSKEDYNLFGAHIFRSTDGGNIFHEVGDGFPTETPTSINAIVIHPTDSDIVYVMTSSYESEKGIGIYKTTDGGENWSPVNNGLDLETNDLQIDPIEPETLYAATANGVYKTTDGGNSWNYKSDGLLEGVSGFPERRQREVFDLAIDPLNPLVLYAAGYMGVYKTNNGGDDWYLVNLGLPVYGSQAESAFDHDRVLEVDASGQVIYAVVGYRERDRLDTMVPYRAILGTPDPFMYTFVVGGETVTVESTSHLSDLVVDLERGELRLTASGPIGTVGRLSVMIPSGLLPGLSSVVVDGASVKTEVEGRVVSFSFDHDGESQVVIR